MIKIDIISGFLGAGKTTLIKKLFSSCFKKEKVALIENEFGEIGIDSSFLKESGVNIKEINSGCICCSLVGNFEKSLLELIETYNVDRIVIEPSGVGKLSDILKACQNVEADTKINIVCTVVDGGKCKMYLKNFGEFYIDQIQQANTVVLSKTDKLTEEKIIEACEMIKNYNPTVTIITTPITELNGDLLLENLEDTVSLVDFLIEQVKKDSCGHTHHHHDAECHCHDHDDGECHCHDHDHDAECHCHDHDHDDGECHCHDHDHDDGECHCHDHHHDDGECCCHDHDHDDGECHCHDHDHHDGECCCHHHHDADEVFDSWGVETPLSFTNEQLTNVLEQLATDKYGIVLRSKGVVKGADIQKWYYFDFVAGDYEIRQGEADVIGKLCVIGNKIDKDAISNLFLRR